MPIKWANQCAYVATCISYRRILAVKAHNWIFEFFDGYCFCCLFEFVYLKHAPAPLRCIYMCRENTITANWQSEKPSATWLKEVQFNSEIEPQIWTFFHEFFVVVSHFGGLNNARYHHTGYMKGRFFMIYIIFASPIMMIVSPFETKIRICIEKNHICVWNWPKNEFKASWTWTRLV